MIGYILLIILCAGSWTLFGIGDKKDVGWVAITGLILGAITTALLVTSTIYVATKHADADDFRHEREFKQELVNSISDTMSPQTISNIFSGAVYFNERIEKNKRHCDSEMWGFIYNKGIAEVEPIVIPKFTYKITIEEIASEE